MGEERNIFLMVIHIKENMSMDYLRAREYIYGMMEANMREILNKVSEVGKAFGYQQTRKSNTRDNI